MSGFSGVFQGDPGELGRIMGPVVLIEHEFMMVAKVDRTTMTPRSSRLGMSGMP